MTIARNPQTDIASGWFSWCIRHARLPLTVAFVLLAIPYAVAAPIFEKNDESLHFAFARHLALGGDLPIQRPGEDTAWRQIGSQPPLYYALASFPLRLFATSDFERERQPNQSPQYDPYAPGNKNVLIITPEKRAFGWRNTTLAALALRLLGIAAGAVTVWMSWAIAETIAQRLPVAALATAITAFNPMLLSVSTAISNDGLVIALSSVALWLIAQCVMSGATWRRTVLIGVLIGLASLSKVSGAVLLPVAVLAALTDSIAWRQRWLHAGAIIGLWMLIAGWWFVRNQALYGDLTGTAAMAAIAGARQLGLADVAGEFQGLRMSYLAMFGHFNIPASDVVYVLWDALLIACGLGLIVHVARGLRLGAHKSPYWRALGLIGLHLLLTLAALVRWTLMTTASEGRLLFPCIAGASLLMALGLNEWRDALLRARLPTPISRLPMLLPIGAMAGLAAVAPFVYVLPAYAPPYVRDVPQGFTPVRQTLSPWAEVVAYRMEPTEVHPGEQVRLSVILRALKTPEFNHSLVANLYGRDNTPLARFDTFTGNGLLPSSQWRAGDMWQDTIAFKAPQDALAPAILRAQFNLYNAGSGEIAHSLDANGQPGAPLYDGSTLLPMLPPDSALTPAIPEVAFGDVAVLESYAFGPVSPEGELAVTLNWRSLKRTPGDYTIFLHVVDAAGQIRAQADGPPLNGEYPTSRWGNAPFAETRRVRLPGDLPAGRYRVLIGLYDSHTNARIAALDRNGARLPDDAFALGGDEVVIP